MKKIKYILASLALVLGIGAVGFSPLMATEANAAICSGAKDCIGDAVDKSGGNNNTTDLNALIKNIVNILLFIVGVASVIMIIIGGLKYTTSAGDQSAITSAKNTILYSIVGLVVAALSFAIVNFVVDKL